MILFSDYCCFILADYGQKKIFKNIGFRVLKYVQTTKLYQILRQPLPLKKRCLFFRFDFVGYLFFVHGFCEDLKKIFFLKVRVQFQVGTFLQSINALVYWFIGKSLRSLN